jgi:hypothetical protein
VNPIRVFWLSFCVPIALACTPAHGQTLDWVLDQRLTATTPQAFFGFAEKMALWGDSALLGHNLEPGINYYERDSSGWNQRGTLTIPPNTPGADGFEGDVALQGNRAVAAATGQDIGTLNAVGAAYIFDRMGDTWQYSARLIASDPMSSSGFGNFLDLDGDRIIVGAYHHSPPGRDRSGAAYIYERRAGQWLQTALLKPADLGVMDEFGSTVSIEGNFAAVGAPFHNNRSGAVYFFENQGGQWNQVQKLILANAESDTRFGNDLDLDGNRLLIGASSERHSGIFDAGAAYVYERGAGGWQQMARLTSGSLDSLGTFGYRVDLDGDRALISTPVENNHGAVYLFQRAPSGTWSRVERFTSGLPDENEGFGGDLAIDGPRILISARDSREAGVRGVGSAYFYEERLFHDIGATQFDEPAIGVGTYSPGPNDQELGFSTTGTNTSGQSPLSGVAASSGARTRVLTHRSRAATTTFSPVTLTGYNTKQFFIDIQIGNTSYEPGDFLTVYLSNGTDQIDVFNVQGLEADDGLDHLAQSGYITYQADIPQSWSTAELVIASSSNSSTGAERFDFDNVAFRGVAVIPEPSALALAAGAGIGLLTRRRRTRLAQCFTAW